MSEDDIHSETASPAAEGPAAAPTAFGARLAAARESAGLSVGDMAARLRLHVNQVKALESEDFARLPEAAYVRGFVRSYARSLGIDPTPLVDDLNRKVAPPADTVVDGMARTRDFSPVRAAAHEQTSRWLVLGLAVIALLVLGFIGWYATRQTASVQAVPATAAVSPAPQSAASTASQPATEAPTAAAVPASAAPSDAAAGNGAVTEPAPAPSQPLASAPAVLTLSFSGSSWVEVTDAAGKVLVSQTAGAGDTLQPVGELPFSVVVGDASKATVAVRGQPLRIEATARGNVARFTVK